MSQATGPDDFAREIAAHPTLPPWAVEVVGRLLDGDEATLDVLERLAGASPWLFSKGRGWLTERPPR